ncbi:metal-dependent hydrolase [Bifidobacterium choloepi]|nr:metal-dependent hydrolase [Bifidobacterium choloepi]
MLGRHHVESGVALGVIGAGVATIAGVRLLTGQPASGLGAAYAQWFSHVLDGVAAMSWGARLRGLAVGVVAFIVGTLLPDIDVPTSSICKILHTGLIRWPFPHRTLTHSIWPILVLLFFSTWLPWLAWLAAGMFTHILLDSLSTSGVCWLWPLTRYRKSGRMGHRKRVNQRHRVHLYKVGGSVEAALNRVLVLGAIVIGVVAVVTLLANHAALA